MVVLRNRGWFLEIIPANGEEEGVRKMHFACLLLYQALAEAFARVLEVPAFGGSPLSLRAILPFPRRKMKAEGWRPSTIWRLFNHSNVDRLIFAYHIGTVRTHSEHSNRTRMVCVANNMKDDASIAHVHSDYACCIIGAPHDEINDILKKGAVPVLRIGSDDDDDNSASPLERWTRRPNM